MNDPAKRKRKVCLVSYCESPTTLPPMLNEGISLTDAGFDVELLCLAKEPGSTRTEERYSGILTQHLPIRTRSLFHSILGRNTPNRIAAALQYTLSYGEYVTRTLIHAYKSQSDVYEAHDLPALLPAILAAKLRTKPVVYRAHELWSEAVANVRFAGYWRLMDRALVPLCDDVVTPDENRSEIYQEEFHAKKRPLTVRNCPPYRPPIESTKLSDELNRRGVKFSTIVLYQGLVSSMRCIEEISEASRYFDDGVVLVIMGSGFEQWQDPASVLAEYDRVVVLPPVPYNELPPYTASADMGILLYRNDCRNNYLCAPNKVFEYMMMGLPVIAANFPGMLKLVEGEQVGLCVDPEDPRAIAAAVNRLAADTDLKTRMKETAIRLSKVRYNWEQEFLPLLKRLNTLSGNG